MTANRTTQARAERDYLDAVIREVRGALSARQHGRRYTYWMKVQKAHRILTALIAHLGIVEEGEGS